MVLTPLPHYHGTTLRAPGMTPRLNYMDAHDTSWMAEANCIGADPNLFFPETRQSQDMAHEARALCAPCPVRYHCAEYAIATYQLGIWGGLSRNERDKIRRKRRARAS